MYQLNVMYFNRTETKDNIPADDLAVLIEDALSHKDGKERAKEIVVFNLSMPYRQPSTGTQPEQQPAP